MSRFITFLRQPLRRKILLFTAIYHLSRAWIIVKKTGFVREAPKLGQKRPGDWRTPQPVSRDDIRDVRWAINAVARSFGDRFTCLMIAIAGKAMLRRFAVSNALVLGANTGSGSEKDEMLAHAWLSAGDMVVFGVEEMEKYAPIVSYVDTFDLPKK
tara:strand:- start:6145 stop:6612 length:468 start_codon:yes stop_codon:yes gene_type:complete